MSSTFAPLLIKYCMVGTDPLIRVSSVMVEPWRGTFKSHRTSTLNGKEEWGLKWCVRERVSVRERDRGEGGKGNGELGVVCVVGGQDV